MAKLVYYVKFYEANQSNKIIQDKSLQKLNEEKVVTKVYRYVVVLWHVIRT